MKNQDQYEEVYKAIGKAVINCQYFEIAFTICSKLALKYHNIDNISDIKPLGSNHFRVPTKAQLNELKVKMDVAEDFEIKMSNVIEQRHDMIHRWVGAGKWQSAVDKDGILKIAKAANQLTQDVNGLSRIFIVYIKKWLDRFPETKGVLHDLEGWLDEIPEEIKNLKIEKSLNKRV